MSAQSPWHTPHVVPARLSFLAIYNPTLGPTDETFDQQLVFHFSRAAHEARVAAKKTARKDGAGLDAAREEENEKLRQIGLAQGMVDFAKSFSDGRAVDSIETEKSRIVLQELEEGWWILASIDLTRLPSVSQSSAESSKKGSEKAGTKPAVEYSAREVSPPALLLEQLKQAHSIFCLHHGPSLSELFVRLRREKFCGTLDRFWSRFARSWDVLLHGNPAVEIFSSLKLASGGELGFGVGEEEWGSGEREVLEDFTRRTDGLVDMQVARFGEPAPDDGKESPSGSESLPWMGSGTEPTASDGVIFSGVGAVDRKSLRSVSLWMRQIYTFGEQAYGVRDNPLRDRRKRRRRAPPEYVPSVSGSADQASSSPRNRSLKTMEADCEAEVDEEEGQAAKDNNPGARSSQRAHGFDASIERSLDKAMQSADETEQQHRTAHVDPSTTWGIPDQYMKYMTLGLSTLNKPAAKLKPPRSPSAASSRAPSTDGQSQNSNNKATRNDTRRPMLKQVDPVPDGENLQFKIANQKRMERKGTFLIGLKGDIDQMGESGEADEVDVTDGSFMNDNAGSRIALRTLQLEMTPKQLATYAPGEMSTAVTPNFSDPLPVNVALTNFRRLRVLIYVRRPFMYCFFFENRTPALQLTDLYRSLHQSLEPIYKPLLSSTSAAKVRERVDSVQPPQVESDTTSISSKSKFTKPPSPIYDLIHDPGPLTVHTSIPNIPEPGTPVAEGIFSSNSGRPDLQSSWARTEALNVHTQILNTLASVRDKPREFERTSKTSRGWWVVWMKVPPSSQGSQYQEEVDDARAADAGSLTLTGTSLAPASHNAGGDDLPPPADLQRTAFLIRKASDAPARSTKASSSNGARAMSGMFSTMALGFGASSGREEDTGSAGAGWGPAALTGGIGVDARRYVEGLLSLNR